MSTEQFVNNSNNLKSAQDKSSLHVLIIVNICLSLAFIIQQFGQGCFCFGGYPPLAFLGAILLMTMPLLFLIFLSMIGIDLFFIYRLWPVARFKSLLPIAILIFGFGTGICSGMIGHKLAFGYFDRHYAEYQAAANFIMQSNDVQTAELPAQYKHLVFMGHVTAYMNQAVDQHTVLEFMVGSGGFAGHTAYLYSPNDNIPEGSNMAKRWPNRTKVRKNWFRASN